MSIPAHHIKRDTLNLLRGKKLNGYEWIYFEDGLHFFSKKLETGYSSIACNQEDLNNGNIEYMAEKGLTREL